MRGLIQAGVVSMFVHRFRSDVRVVLHQRLRPASHWLLHSTAWAKTLLRPRMHRFNMFDPGIQIRSTIRALHCKQRVKGPLIVEIVSVTKRGNNSYC